MTTNSKKRTLEEFTADSHDAMEPPPSKKAKLDSNHNGDSTLLQQSIDDLKDASNVTLDQIKQLFAINTKEFDNRYEVCQHFHNLALTLIRDLVLILPSKNKMFQFVEFEFYCVDGAHHNDVFAHCDDIQLTTNAAWYFHRSGNASVAGYNFVTDAATHNNNKKWLNPKANAKFRNGTFKGCDITFGACDVHFGGILIRSMRELKPLNTAFSNEDSVVYSPVSDIIEGPCKCVDHILKQTGFESLNALTASKEYNASIFGDDTNVMYVDLAQKYKIKSLSPKRVHKSNTAGGSVIPYDAYFHASPRVGLTLKKEKSLKGTKLETFQNIKQDFVMAPYRCIRSSCVAKIKRYKACIALSLMCRGYYYDKLHGTQSDVAPLKGCYEAASDIYKQKQLQNLMKQCRHGQTNSSMTIKEAEKKFPTNNNGLAQLFGALMHREQDY